VLGLLRLGRDRRLHAHGEFVRAQRSGRRVGTTHFTLLVALQPQVNRRAAEPTHGTEAEAPSPRPARLGLVVGRKVGTAVRRNRVKRLCRECFRTWPDLLPDGVDLVVIAREGAHTLGLADVRAEWRAVERLLRKRSAEALALAPGPKRHHVPGQP
jgi:ribonuclease P protein component